MLRCCQPVEGKEKGPNRRVRTTRAYLIPARYERRISYSVIHGRYALHSGTNVGSPLLHGHRQKGRGRGAAPFPGGHRLTADTVGWQARPWAGRVPKLRSREWPRDSSERPRGPFQACSRAPAGSSAVLQRLRPVAKGMFVRTNSARLHRLGSPGEAPHCPAGLGSGSARQTPAVGCCW